MVDRPFADKRVFGPFISINTSCPKRQSPVNWYSNILDEFISFTDIDNDLLEDEYNRRYDIDFDRIAEELELSLGMRVGDIGQVLFIAQEVHPNGLVTDERRSWITDNDRDPELIEGIEKLAELTQDIVKEAPDKICIYRGVHGQIASSIKLQLEKKSSASYPTRAIEFWTTKYSTATTFALEGIRGNREFQGVSDAVIISRELNVNELLQIMSDDVRMLPNVEGYEIPENNIWIIK